MMLAQMTFKSLNISLTHTVIAIGASLAASVAVYLMYHLFYGTRNIGAGVDRSFILGGPAITTLFLGIQSSIPLSLGLLGALSFVRFRTPVKDSAEIGFLLLLIASSIGIATSSYSLVIILFLVVFVSLCGQWLVQNRFSFQRFNNLMISAEQDVVTPIETELTNFLRSRLGRVNLKTVSVMDGQVSMHYQFRRKRDFDKIKFMQEINQLSEAGKLNIFFGA